MHKPSRVPGTELSFVGRVERANPRHNDATCAVEVVAETAPLTAALTIERRMNEHSYCRQ